MDEIRVNTTYRLHITLHNADGYVLHSCRGVDTYHQAELIARQGHEHDERDGSKTDYTLAVWDNFEDRSTLRQEIPIK